MHTFAISGVQHTTLFGKNHTHLCTFCEAPQRYLDPFLRVPLEAPADPQGALQAGRSANPSSVVVVVGPPWGDWGCLGAEQQRRHYPFLMPSKLNSKSCSKEVRWREKYVLQAEVRIFHCKFMPLRYPPCAFGQRRLWLAGDTEVEVARTRCYIRFCGLQQTERWRFRIVSSTPRGKHLDL